VNETQPLTLIKGSQPSFAAEVARLVDEPDGVAAWAELKRLTRKTRPAANSVLSVVELGSQAAPASTEDLPGSHEQG
jgi:hypothetical protein